MQNAYPNLTNLPMADKVRLIKELLLSVRHDFKDKCRTPGLGLNLKTGMWYMSENIDILLQQYFGESDSAMSADDYTMLNLAVRFEVETKQ